VGSPIDIEKSPLLQLNSTHGATKQQLKNFSKRARSGVRFITQLLLRGHRARTSKHIRAITMITLIHPRERIQVKICEYTSPTM